MGDYWSVLSAVLTCLGSVAWAYDIGKKQGHRQAMHDLNNEREARRFSEVYAPLVGLFLNCHVVTCSTVSAPYLRQRIRNALEFANEQRYVKSIYALFDKRKSESSGEIEYGGWFPLHEISTHLKGREQFSDEVLLDLVATANRARYEERPEESELTAADLALFRHVHAQHAKLNNRFVGAV